MIESKESEIASLCAQLVASRSQPVAVEPVHHDAGNEIAQQDVVNETAAVSPRQQDTSTVQPARKGKAPPVDLFTDEGSDVLWEDWLPTLERTATWNNWTENEKLLQLAGHLQNKPAQEWTLLSIAEKATFISATRALGARLDRGGKALAGKSFVIQYNDHLKQSQTLSYDWSGYLGVHMAEKKCPLRHGILSSMGNCRKDCCMHW